MSVQQVLWHRCPLILVVVTTQFLIGTVTGTTSSSPMGTTSTMIVASSITTSPLSMVTSPSSIMTSSKSLLLVTSTLSIITSSSVTSISPLVTSSSLLMEISTSISPSLTVTSSMTTSPSLMITSPSSTVTSSPSSMTFSPSLKMTSFPSSTVTSFPSSTMTSPSSMMTSPSSMVTSSPSSMVTSSSSMVTSSPSSMVISPSSITASSSSMVTSPSSTVTSSPSSMTSSPSSMMTSSPSSTVTSSPSSMMTSPSSTVTSSPSSMVTSSLSMVTSSPSSMVTSPSSMMTSPSSTVTSSPSSTVISPSSITASSSSMVTSFLSMLSNSVSLPMSQSLPLTTTSSTILSSSGSQSVVLTETSFMTSLSTSSMAADSSFQPVMPRSSSLAMSSIAISTDVPTNTQTMVPVSSMSTVVSPSSRAMTATTTVSSIPTESPGNILNFIQDIFKDTTILLVVAIGGPCILILLVVIIVFCCCYCCRLRKRGRYSIESDQQVSRGHSINNPIPSYKMTLKNLQQERQRMDDFVETELGPEPTDDSIRYQGHSQVQHSQPYSPLSDVAGSQSLSKLTPFNPSQIISQAKGGISVDDIDEDVPEKDDHVVMSQVSQQPHRRQSSTLDNDGRDSPFMHLSDNLSGSRGRISQRSSSDPHTELIGMSTQPTQASQYSHLGLGVLHGGDMVFTNTASLAEEMHNSIGMIGIDKSLLLSKDSDLHSHRTASPLLHDNTSTDLDDTPVREQSAIATLPSQTRKLKNLTSLTSLTSLEPTKLPTSSTPTKADSKLDGSRKKLDLGSITALSTSSDDHVFTHSDVVNSDLQETPERQRRHTVESASAFKRNPGKSNQSKLGKLTSIEYIRASLRMKLNRIKRNDNTDSVSNKKKPLKSALRKTSSANSQNSSPDSINSSRNNSFVYSNRHAHHYNGFSDVSPQHGGAPNPAHFHPGGPVDPYDYPPPGSGPVPMGGPDPYGPYNGMYPPPPGPVYPPRVPEPYHMVALSPPGYAPEPLSPILSVSQFDHPGMYPAPEIGILPQYGMPMAPGARYDQSFLPPRYDDDDDDDIPALHSPYRPGDQGGGASQRNVTWDLKPREIPDRVSPEPLTPSDIDDDL